MYNRKQRRQIAKSLGLSKKETLSKNPETTYGDILNRSIAAGKQIHSSNKEEMYNQIRKADAEAEARMIENLIAPTLDKYGNVIKEGMTIEQATDIVANNKAIEEKRLEKKNKRK